MDFIEFTQELQYKEKKLTSSVNLEDLFIPLNEKVAVSYRGPPSQSPASSWLLSSLAPTH